MQVTTYAFTENNQTISPGSEAWWTLNAPANTTIVSVGWQIVAGNDIGGLMPTQCFVSDNGNSSYIEVYNNEYINQIGNSNNTYTVQVSLVLVSNSSNTYSLSDFNVRSEQRMVVRAQSK